MYKLNNVFAAHDPHQSAMLIPNKDVTKNIVSTASIQQSMFGYPEAT
jgi:hypothetical protein